MVKLNLVPKKGKLTAEVIENKKAGIPRTLIFAIEIPLKSFKFEGESQSTSVRLDMIQVDVKDWKELADKEFTFPVNPEPGYIDGSLYLADAHNPIDTTRIRFGALGEKSIPANLDFVIDFTYEGPEDLGKVAHTWDVELAINSSELDAVVQEFHQPKKKPKK